jgi:transcriptional regulator with XRE-family HTH domain
MAGDEPRRAELGRFLKARRAAIQPADVGLSGGPGRRRTPGLRREEVAQLSGVGIAWYTWLEQGRVVATSAQVIDALAKALLLDDDAHRHLRALADLPLPPTRIDAQDHDPVPDALQRILHNLLPNPAYIIDRRFDYLAWNRAYCGVWRELADIPQGQRNLVWLMLTDPSLRRLLVGWERRAHALLDQLRTVAGRYPDDTRIASLVADLQATSPQFRDWWPQYTVGRFTEPEHVIDHPQAGQISFDLAQLRIAGHPSLILVLQTPVTDADRVKLTRLMDQPSGRECR